MENFISKNRSFSVLVASFILSINLLQAQTNVSGNITTNTTWTKAASPYIISSNILISSGVTLTLQPGTIVKFNENYGFTINGELISNGNSSDSVYFISNSPSKNWKGITFTSSSISSNVDVLDNYISGSIISYTSISSASSINGAIYTVNNSLLVKNSSIFNNTANGINFSYDGSFSFNKIIVKDSKIVANIGNGISFDGYRMNGTFKVINNTISNNSGNGITTGGGDGGGSHINYFTNNTIKNNGGTGIIANANGTQTINYNLIYGNLNGIYSRGNGTYSIIKNQIISNLGYGLNCIYTTHIINNNIVVNNKGGLLFSQGGDYTVNNNLFINNNYFVKSNGSWSSSINIFNNMVAKNASTSENLISTFQPESGTPSYKVNNNNIIYNNYKYLIFNERNVTSNNIDAKNNFWGTTATADVQNLVYDFNINSNKSSVDITPILTSIITTIPISIVKNITKTLSGGQVVLTWTANPESDIAGYKIHYGGFTGYSYTTSADAGNVLTYTLPAGVAITEDIAVTAYDASKDGTDDQFDGNESWYSPANKAPEAPTALIADAGPRNVKLNWTASTSTGVNKYNVYKSTDGTNYTFLWSTINNYTTEETITPGVKYYYKVTAFDSLDLSYDNYGLESPYSNVISAIPSNRIYVNRITGNDANNGSIANPVAKLQIGVNKAENGDTVVISDHSYTERVTITGTGKTITLGSQYIFDYDSTHITAASLDGTGFGYSHTLISSAASLVIHGITIKNMIGMGIDCSTGTILNLKNVRINNLGFNSANVFEYILNAPKIYVDSSRIYGNHDISGMFNVQDSVSFKNSKFHDNIAGLLYYSTSGQSNKAFLYNSLFSDNKTGLRVDYLVHNVRSVISQRNKFLNNTLSLFSGSSAAYQRFENNLFYKNTSAIKRGPQESGGDSLILYHNTFIGNGTDMSFNISGKWKGLWYNNIFSSTINFDGPTPSRSNYINIDIRGNIFKTYPSFSYVDTTSSLNITRANVLFKDTANLDFSLSNINPDLGLGYESTYPIEGDLLGNTRPNPIGSKPDIGAYESEFAFASPILSKTEPGNKKVALFWTQTPNTYIKAYKIFRSTSIIPDNSTSTFIADVTGVGTLTYVDASTDLVNGTTYYYRLKAVHNDNSLSGLSNELTAIPADVAIPTNFKLDNGPATARLNWISVGLTGAKYQLFRGANVNTKTLLIDSLNAITYDDATLARNTTYYYWIKAMNATGALSEFSAPLTLTPTNIWYVDSASGNNTTGLGSLIAPYLKIQKGIDRSINGDTVYVKPGTYSESILINKSILVKSTEGVSKTKLIQESGIGYSIKVFNPAFSDPYTTTRINGFYMKGTGNSSNSIGLRVEQKAYAEIDNLFMDGYDVALSTYYGYYSVNNSIFYGNRIFAYGDAGDVDKSNIVQNSTIINTIWSVYEASTNSTNKYYNLIITNEKSKPFQSPNPFNGPRPFLYNVILDKTFANYNPQDGSTKFIVDDAESMRFKNFALKDFRLENTSPAIGFGNTTLTNAFDYDGQARPNPTGSNPDAGAYENIYDHPAPFIDTDSSRNGFVLLKMTQTPAGSVNKINIYKGLTTLPTTKYKDTTLVSKYADSANSIFNKIIYYRLTSVGASNLESGYSNEVRTISFTPPSLNFPADLSIKADTNINFQWEKIDNATNYKIQYSTDSNFVTNVVELAKTDTFYLKTRLIDNTSYFWRIQTLDTVHYSKWSNLKRFQTFVRKPILNTISTVNRVVTINWSVNSLRNIKAFKIYRGTATNPTTKIDSISSASLTYKDSVTNGVKYYYRITAVNTDNIESLYSNELFANSFGVTVLDSPSNNKVKEILKPTFKWQSVEFATKYNIQISTSSLFAIAPILDTVTSLTSLLYAKGLSDNTTYYWRIRVGDNNGYGNWAEKNSFQTYVLAPNLISVKPSNKIDTLNWSVLSSNNIKYFKIYRDTISSPQVLIDSIAGSLRKYIDTTNLQLNKKYFYTIITGNNENIESSYSNVSFATPFNTKPKAVALGNKTYNSVGEYNYVRTTYSSTGSSDNDGKIVDFKWYVNDSLVNSVDSILVYYYNQGSNKVKLVITDNDGGKDSSTSTVSLSSFIKTFKGGFLGGITALSQNLIYTADSTFDPISGASITMLDRSGNTIYPLVVSSKIFTTPSVSSDSSVFITSGSSLNGFNKSGAPLWSTIPLGGLSYVTPTIDSLLSRIYVGVSNKNFFAIDYKTGKVAWSIFGDAPINSSAVITGDRKLVFTSQSGTLYGFDIRTNAVQTSPKWTLNFGEVITKSPAVDGSNNLIIGTQSGKVLKVKLNSDGTITRIWTIDVASEIQASPVIDADGFLYVGNKLGDFYKLNPDNGATIWKYSTGAAIKSTPTISEFGTIYISNTNGLVTALNTDKSLKWTYQADGAISANMLYISNMLYIGTERGKFFAIYDNPNTNTVNTGLSININKNNFTSYSTGSLASVLQSSIQPEYQYYYESFKNGSFNFTLGDQVVKPKKPIWGTFQGNNQRTGSAAFECPAVPIIRIPDCTEFADSIKITTSNLTDKYWVVNDKTLNTITDTIISVKSTDKYKLMAYNANGCNVYSNESIFIPNSTLAKPKIVTSNGGTKFCEGDSIVLSSNINTAKYQWNFSSSPVIDATAKNLSTSLQGAYSVTAINEFGCKATSDLALILTTPKPAVAAIDGVNALCIGATSKLTNATVGGVWSSGAETIVKVDASGNISSVAAGTGAINYTITANGCSNTSKINIKVNETPVAPKADNVALCIGGTSTSLIANATGGHSLLWYGSNATGGQSSGTAPVPSTNAQGSVDYYVSQSNNTTTCESPRTKVTLMINELPSAPSVSSVIYCSNDVASSLTALSSTGNSLLWYGQNATGGASASTSPTPLTINTGSSDYYVSQINQLTGCESPRSKLTVKINAIPASPTVNAYTFCSDVTSSLLSATADIDNNLNWYGSSATGGSASITAPTAVTKTAGVFNYYVSQKNTITGCESARSKIVVTINVTPSAPKADNVALCIGGTSTSLIANATGGHSLLWYGSSATGGQSSGTAPIPSTNAQGSTDYYVSQSNNSTTCESPRTKVTVSVGPAPATPTITRDANGNLTSSATIGNQWYKNGAEIIGATSTLYKPTEVANYAVKIQGVCVSPMSTTYYFLITDVINLSATEFIKLAPNPFQSKLNFDFVIKGYQKLNFDVFEMASGRKVTSRVGLTPGSPVYLPELSGGTYIVRITSADGKLSYQFKMMKL
jgi:hypothetical protein